MNTTTSEEGAARPARKSTPRKKKGPGLSPDDTIAAAARKTIRFHFKHLLGHEPGTRRGKNIEALHQMRVATRRLREALRLFGPYLPAKRVRRLLGDLRRMTRMLGPVRDLDVHIDRARRHGGKLLKSDRDALSPLLRSWNKERDAARKKLLRYLDSKSYRTFKADFEEMIGPERKPKGKKPRRKKPPAKPTPQALGHIAPALIWRNYQKVRMYETLMDDPSVETLHALRIDCKRLRYALELLSDVLGPSGETAIALVRQAQDHLGAMHDAYVANLLLDGFAKDWKKRARAEGRSIDEIAGVARYAIACQEDERQGVETFAPIWTQIHSPGFRQLLADAAARP